MSNTRSTSKAGLEFISKHEGISLEAYADPVNKLTIGTGHLLTRSELSSGKMRIAGRQVRWREGISQQQAIDLLAQDVKHAERCITEALGEKRTWYLTQNRYDSLVSFVFNIGCGAFQDSTLLRVLREGNYQGVPTQLKRWVYASGVELPGLRNRRSEEAELWEMSNNALRCPRCQHEWTA